jgi:hypothetical protein
MEVEKARTHPAGFFPVLRWLETLPKSEHLWYAIGSNRQGEII